MKMVKQLPGLDNFIAIDASMNLRLWLETAGSMRKPEYMSIIIGILNPLHLKIKHVLREMAASETRDLCRVSLAQGVEEIDVRERVGTVLFDFKRKKT